MGEGMKEGHVKKGGVNKPPQTPKPNIRPPAMRPPSVERSEDPLDAIERTLEMVEARIESIERLLSQSPSLRDQCSNCQTGNRSYCLHLLGRASMEGAIQNCAHHVIKEKCDGSGWLQRGSLQTRMCSGCDNCGHGMRRPQ